MDETMPTDEFIQAAPESARSVDWTRKYDPRNLRRSPTRKVNPTMTQAEVASATAEQIAALIAERDALMLQEFLAAGHAQCVREAVDDLLDRDWRKKFDWLPILGVVIIFALGIMEILYIVRYYHY